MELVMFYVGQKVVCVNDSWVTNRPDTRPVKGIVYTIRGIDGDERGTSIYLVEIVNPARMVREGLFEVSFWAWRFRPVTDISTLQAIVAEVKTGKPRKIKADRFDKERV